MNNYGIWLLVVQQRLVALPEEDPGVNKGRVQGEMMIQGRGKFIRI